MRKTLVSKPTIGTNMLLERISAIESKYEDRTKQLKDFQRLMSVRNEEKGVYDWFPFFQAFTSGFLAKIFKERLSEGFQRILDPFVGSGNTLVACMEFGKEGFGLEVNPLFSFIAEVKTKQYSEKHFADAKRIVLDARNEDYEVDVPQLSSFANLFNHETLKRLIILRNSAMKEGDASSASLLLLALTSELLRFSSAKRYGKGLHVVGEPPDVRNGIFETILLKLDKMCHDYFELYNSIKKQGRAHILPYSVFQLEDAACVPNVDLVFTSPPYCNSSDYVEMYKLELWFLEFVTKRSEFKELSRKTVRSHLSFDNSNFKWSNNVIAEICDTLETTELWNPHIPTMIRGYFDDLHTALESLGKKLVETGKMVFIIGNSSYSGIVVPSDLLLAEAAESLDFEVESIEVARQLLPSPQQRKKLDENSLRLMRESIVTISR